MSNHYDSILLMICICKCTTSLTCHFIVRLVTTDHSWWSRVSKHAHRLSKETKILADDATRDLEKAMPALDAAVDALEKLDKKSIAEASGLQKGVDTKWRHQGVDNMLPSPRWKLMQSHQRQSWRPCALSWQWWRRHLHGVRQAQALYW